MSDHGPAEPPLVTPSEASGRALRLAPGFRTPVWRERGPGKPDSELPSVLGVGNCSFLPEPSYLVNCTDSRLVRFAGPGGSLGALEA